MTPLIALIAFVVLPCTLAYTLRPSNNNARITVTTQWRAVLAVRVTTALAGIAAAVLIMNTLPLGAGLFAIPGTIGAFIMLGIALGESVIRPTPTTRTASSTPRNMRGFLPPALTWVTLIMAFIAVATGTFTTLTATADDMGRAGRALTETCGPLSSTRSPYPGWYYTGPALIGLILAVVCAALALAVVTRRARGFTTQPAADNALRHRSATLIVATLLASIGITTVGVSALAAMALTQMTDCDSSLGLRITGWAFLASAAATLVVLGWSITTLRPVHGVQPAALPSKDARG